MSEITIEELKDILGEFGYKKRSIAKMNFSPNLQPYLDLEVIPVFNNKGNGVVFFRGQTGSNYVPVCFDALRLKADTKSGRYRPIVCDLCFTWRTGSGISRVTFYSAEKAGKSIGLLCCSNLDCSLQVRSLTENSKVSRAQLREDLDDNGRILRLKEHYTRLVVNVVLS